MLAALREISVPVDTRESTPKPAPALSPAPVSVAEHAPESDSIVDVREMAGKEDAPAALQPGSESEATDEDMVVVDRP